MYVEFEAVTYKNETIVSNCIIQKELPYGLDIRLNVGTKWVRIKNETLRILIDKKYWNEKK
jgi:hypothetical protein